MTDEHLAIRQVLGGDAEAFRSIVERYERPIFAMLRSMTGRAADVEDLAQDVFWSAYRNLGSYDPARGRFSTWLFAIARNRCLNELRKRRPQPVETVPDAGHEAPPDAAASEAEVFRRLDAALATLPEPQRTAFVLAELAGLAYGEIAAIEGTTVGTVKSRMSRARDKLRACLETYVGEAT